VIAAPPRTAVWAGLDHLAIEDALSFIRRVEALGYEAFWTREGFGREPFPLLAAAARETSRIILGTGIANVYARDPITMRAAAATLAELAPDRFILGLGVSHAPWVEGIRGHQYGPPRQALSRYLDRLDADYRAPEPFGRPPIVLAALRRGMLELARDRTQGAFPYLTSVEGVTRARSILDATGSKPWLIVSLAVLPDVGPSEFHEAATAYVANYLRLPAYVAALRELGYGDEDLGQPPSSRLVEAVVVGGARAQIVGRIRAMLDAGADEVAIVPLAPDGSVGSLAAVEALAPPW
jgi:probable F420-dependent oxidoreductase